MPKAQYHGRPIGRYISDGFCLARGIQPHFGRGRSPQCAEAYGHDRRGAQGESCGRYGRRGKRQPDTLVCRYGGEHEFGKPEGRADREATGEQAGRNNGGGNHTIR